MIRQECHIWPAGAADTSSCSARRWYNQELLGSLLRAARKELGGFSVGQLAALMGALGEAGLRPSGGWLDAAAAASREKLGGGWSRTWVVCGELGEASREHGGLSCRVGMARAMWRLAGHGGGGIA